MDLAHASAAASPAGSRIFLSREQFFGDATYADKKLRRQPHIQLGALRAASPESDYGVWWRGQSPHPIYRLSLIAYTAELYLAKCGDGGPEIGTVFELERRAWPNGAHQVIGLLPIDTLRIGGGDDGVGTWYRYADTILGEGILDPRRDPAWADVCGKEGGLRWIHDRLAAHNCLTAEAR